MNALLSLVSILAGFFYFDVVQRGLLKLSPEKSWILLHFLGNLAVAVLSGYSFLTVVIDPLSALTPRDETSYPLLIVLSMHLYHLLRFKVSPDDVFHHVIYVFFLAGSFLYWDVGNFLNAMLFLMCGLPGALDYLMILSLPPKVRSKYNRIITLYIRSPLVSSLTYIMALNIFKTELPPILSLVTILLCLYNTQSHTENTIRED
jgi:hypothetical protein